MDDPICNGCEKGKDRTDHIARMDRIFFPVVNSKAIEYDEGKQCIYYQRNGKISRVVQRWIFV
jgi:hypothetical protein